MSNILQSQEQRRDFNQDFVPEGFEHLRWLIDAIAEANPAADMEVAVVDGNIVCTNRNNGGLMLPQEKLSARNHAPVYVDAEKTAPYLYSYLVVPADGIAAELKAIQGKTIPPEERWQAYNLPPQVTDITKLKGQNAEYAELTSKLMNYISIKANTTGIYEDVDLQNKYAAAMAVVLAVMNQIDYMDGLFDREPTDYLNVMRAGGALQILDRAVGGDNSSNQFPGAKRIVTNETGGEEDTDSMMLGIIDEFDMLTLLNAGETVGFREVVVASNATLMGFVIVLEYLKRKPGKIEVMAPFITQPGVADFIKFCAARGIDLHIVTASIAPALNDNWYVVIPPDADASGNPTNKQYLEVSQASDHKDNTESDVYYMGDGGDILASLLPFMEQDTRFLREYLFPIILEISKEFSDKDRELILELFPDIGEYVVTEV